MFKTNNKRTKTAKILYANLEPHISGFISSKKQSILLVKTTALIKFKVKSFLCERNGLTKLVTKEKKWIDQFSNMRRENQL